jgi:hypothetical protein
MSEEDSNLKLWSLCAARLRERSAALLPRPDEQFFAVRCVPRFSDVTDGIVASQFLRVLHKAPSRNFVKNLRAAPSMRCKRARNVRQEFLLGMAVSSSRSPRWSIWSLALTSMTSRPLFSYVTSSKRRVRVISQNADICLPAFSPIPFILN